MKNLFPKLLLLTTIFGAAVICLMAVWTLIQPKERSHHQWGMAALNKQTVQIICGKVTFYYLGYQNPDTSMPISYREQAVDLSYCANLMPPEQRFSFLTSPAQKCKPIESSYLKWQCQGDFVPALYSRQQRR